MNIIYLNHYAGSPRHGMSYRPYYLAREWVRSGHAVRIIACAFSHVRSIQPELIQDGHDGPQKEMIDGIDYSWYSAPTYQGNGLKRALNIFIFLKKVWLDSKSIVESFKPDAVIASSTYPMDIWVARRLSRLAKAKLVFELHDLWPLSPIELGGMSPRHPFVQICQLAENYAYKNADVVISMLPKVHEHMASHGLNLKKLHIIPNGITPEDWLDEAQLITGELEKFIAKVKNCGNIIVGYAGSHGLPNALDSLLDAASILRDKPIRFVLVGDGLEKGRLMKRVEFEELSNVTMFEPVLRAQLPSLLRQFDIAYIGLKSQPLFRFGVSPNKLMDYMMAAKPILFSISSGNNPIVDAGCGLTVPPESPERIAEGIMKLANLSIAEREKLGRNGQSYVQKHHSYPVLAKKFIETIEGR